MAATQQKRDKELRSIPYELFIAALSVLSIFNLVLVYFAKDPAVRIILLGMNLLLSLIFLGDFAMRILSTHHKSRYFFRQMGWADLLGSVPFPQTKIFRIFRLIRVYRLSKEYGARNMVREFLADRAGSALLVLLLLGTLVMEFGSAGVVRAESASPNANITTGGDAMWYTIVTISTVGYGDKYPVTTDGRLIGTCIIIVGVGIFGTFTGYLANLFLAPRKKEEEHADAKALASDDPRAKLAELKALLAEQQEAQLAVQAKMAELEALLPSPVTVP